MTKQEIQVQIDELHKMLDEYTEVEPFTSKGEWYTNVKGEAYSITGDGASIRQAFDLWQSKEIAETVYALQLRQRKMLSFVSQHQELDEGHNIVYQIGSDWFTTTLNPYHPDVVLMTEDTADKMLQAIENGSLDLS